MPVRTCKKCGRITAGRLGAELPKKCENCGYNHQAKQAEESNLNAGLCDIPVQAIKDAIWHVDANLQNMDMELLQEERTKKCLRELHDFLDRIGT